MIFSDFLKALRQIDDRAFRGVLLQSLGVTLLLLVLFVYGAGLFTGWLLPDQISLWWIGTVTIPNALESGLGIGAGLILSVFLMMPVASLFVGALLERIAHAVEAKHFPDLPPARGLSWREAIADAFGFLGVMVLANLLALLLYLVLAPLAPVLFWGLNGLLLGREYFQLVALRRLDVTEAKALRRKHFFSVWFAGGLMAVPLTLPLVNLIVPILGVATFTHMFHRLNRPH